MLLDMKGRKCGHCGQSYPDCCYDMHHLNPAEKEFQFNQLYAHSLTDLIAEAEKCVLLCSNCHRIEHDRLRKENGLQS